MIGSGISSIDKNIIPVGEFTDLAPHWKRSGFYAKREWKYWGMAFYDIDRTMNPVSESPTNTPAPSAPKPTPTPIPGWFVLDGFGGIHGANPAIQRPVLPYWWNFNIARDIEPDPLGRGWYMLDGFGGIHTSSPDLPKPTNLPYFGFDIARNLKVKEVNGKVEFYLLDCYGVIHSTDAGFNQGSLPIFGEDNARTLRFEPGGNVLLMMDVYGTIYRSDNTMTDTIRFAPPYAISPVMRSFVRFPDETTVMLDLFGGRHTNPYYPAKDIVNGLPGDFYSPAGILFGTWNWCRKIGRNNQSERKIMKNFCIAIVMTIIFFCGVLSGQTGETPTETPFITPAITLTPTKTNPKPTPTPYSKDKRFLKKYNYGTADERFGGLGFSPDGKSMYAATSTTHITRWNMDTGLAEKDYQYSINDASFSGPMNLSQDGAKLFICTNQNGVYHYVMWDTEEKKVLLHRSWDFEINKYQLFDNGNKCVIAARGNRVEILDIKQLQSTSRHFFPEYSRFLDIKVSPDEKYCAVAYSDGDNEYNARLVILNMNTMELIHDYELKTKSVNLISWLPDGTHIWVYGNTWKGNDFDKSNMDLLDTGTGDYVWHAEYSSGWRSIRFTRRGDTFLAFIENTLRVYNAFTGDILATMPHQSYITAAEFSPDEKSILTSTLDGMQTPISILWDIHDLGESPIPTLIPFTPTPTLTYTPTIPPVSQMYVNNIKTQSLGFMVFDDIETDPRNGDIYITKIDNKTITIRGPVSSVTGITGDVPVIATLTLQDDWYRDLLITTKGKFYVETLNGIYAILPDGSASLAYLYKKENIQYRFPLIEVKENAKISGAKPGDIIVILDECQDYETYEFTTSISALDLSGENPVLRTLSKERYPFLIREYAIGPEGYLYFLVNLDRAASRAIMRYELNGTFTKVHQIDPRWAADKMVYWPKDNAFYLHSDTFNSYNQFSLYRISMTDETPTLILGHYLIPFIMAVSSDGNALYLMGEIVKNQVFYGNFLEKLTLLSEFPTPSVTKKPEYFPTPVSTDYPIPTATGTPTPYIPAVLDESYTAIPLLEFDKYQFVKLGTKENSDEVVF